MSIVVDNYEEQLGQAILDGDLAGALTLEEKLGRILRIHDELEPLAAIALLRDQEEVFKWILERRGVNSFNKDGARKILKRCFGEGFSPNL